MDWRSVLWAGAAYAVLLLASGVLVVVVFISIPQTYFLGKDARRLWVDQHPLVSVTLHVLKNLLGVGLVLSGIVLSVPGVPGQGILTVLIGLLLLDFPGKRRWERRLVSRPHVLEAINGIRWAFGRSPLEVPGDDDA